MRILYRMDKEKYIDMSGRQYSKKMAAYLIMKGCILVTDQYIPNKPKKHSK